MGTIQVESRDGGIGILKLNNGVTNAIGPEMVDELCTLMPDLEKEYRALVLAGGTKFFSMGFDLPHLLELDRAAFSEFFSRFNQVTADLFALSLPTCCAIEGHAVAGGCILALGCDYRLAAAQKKIGLNEIRLGVPVPHLAEMILRQTVGERVARDLLYTGSLVAASEAADRGLVDALHETGSVVDAAWERLAAIADYPRAAFAAIKAGRTAPLLRRYATEREDKNRAFLDCWFDPATQMRLQEAASRFRAPGAGRGD